MTDKIVAPRTAPCPLCGMTFRLSRPKNAAGTLTRCAESGCSRRFGHSANSGNLVKTWIETDPDIDRVVAAVAS